MKWIATQNKVDTIKKIPSFRGSKWANNANSMIQMEQLYHE